MLKGHKSIIGTGFVIVFSFRPEFSSRRTCQLGASGVNCPAFAHSATTRDRVGPAGRGKSLETLLSRPSACGRALAGPVDSPAFSFGRRLEETDPTGGMRMSLVRTNLTNAAFAKTPGNPSQHV
jgi:hypothetical protein